MDISPIHPFPARMAPELVRRSLAVVPKGGLVLDPMCGSGTVARIAVERGIQCVGIDIDPLAVIMSQAWTTYLEPDQIRYDAAKLVDAAKSLSGKDVERTKDPETEQFISYWFGPRQESELAHLATVLRQFREPTKGVLSIALSRIIVSKEMMASLARDTSHSRPHKVADSNNFNVYAGFLRSARHVASRLEPYLIHGKAEIRRGDARMLEGVADESFDLALTSPPYLNAIDYLRGHRMALVWLGYEMKPLREARSGSIGSEKGMSEAELAADISTFVIEKEGSTIGNRHRAWIRRYSYDMNAVLRQIRRVVKPTGGLAMVLGNSFIRGAEIDNAGLVESLAEKVGFRLDNRHVREIPARRRYLPPPGSGQNALDARMRTETLLTFSMA